MEWRQKWTKNWSEVRYCSDACRRNRLNATDEALEQTILSLLSARARGATICPSEAARAIAPHGDWSSLMPRARNAARRLVNSGHIVITQSGRIVDPSTAKGPIRLRQAR